MHRKLIEFLKDLFVLGIQNPGRPGFGIAVSSFLDVVENGFFAYVCQMENIAINQPNSSQEVRLNNAGLKMVWTWKVKNNRVKIFIGGDQVEYYQEFVEKARGLIKDYNFDKEVY